MAVKVDDIELIKSFQAGDPDAFTNVVSQYREPLFRHAMRRLNNVAAAEDAVQETFFRAYRAFDRLRDDSRLGPWLHHILSNVCVDEANRRQRDTDKSARAGSDPFNTPIGPGVEEQLGLDVDNAPVVSALHTLPANYQQALTMRFVDELTYDEIAVSAGITEQNVRARVSRARTAMRAALRGVAAVPVFVLGLTRRSSRSASALDRVEHTHRATMATEGATSMSKMATTLGPAIETVNAVAMSAHHSVPLATKAALGIGAVALATMSAGPERPEIPPPPVPADAAASTEVDLDPVPAVAAAPQGSGQAATRQAPVPVTSPAVAAEQRSPAPPPTPEPVTADTAAPTTTAAPATTAAPTTAPSNAAPAPSPTEPVVEPPPVLTGASLSVSGLSITPSGPRVDVAGSVSVKIGDVTHGGSLSGRLAIDAEADGSGRHRLEGTVTVSLADGTVLDLRLAGHAVPTGGDPAPAPPPEPPSQPLPEPPTPSDQAEPGSTLGSGSGSGEHATSDGASAVGDTAQVQPTAPAATTHAASANTTAANRSYSVSGQFRLSGGEALSLAGAGSFSGTFGPGTLALTLTP